MDQFHDGHHVWLPSRVHGTYLHAEDDGESVSLRQRRASLNTAWEVHLYNGDGDTRYELLHSAAYGRYLAATDDDGEGASLRVSRALLNAAWALHLFHGDGETLYVLLHSAVYGRYLAATDDDGEGASLRESRTSLNAAWAVHLCHGDGDALYVLLHSAAYGRYQATTEALAPRVPEQNYDQPQAEAIRWDAVSMGSGDDILVCHVAGRHYRYLRANGRYLPWNNSVSVDDFQNVRTMMQCVVEPIPARQAMPGLPGPIRAHLPGDLSVIMLGRTVAAGQLIRFVRASDDGFYTEEGWSAFQFKGRSVYHLRNEMAMATRVGVPELIMCVRAGRYGRPTPLVVNLTCDGYGDTIEIAVPMDGTPGILEYKQKEDVVPARQKMTCNADIYNGNIINDTDLLPATSNSIWNVERIVLQRKRSKTSGGSPEALPALTRAPAARHRFQVQINDRSLYGVRRCIGWNGLYGNATKKRTRGYSTEADVMGQHFLEWKHAVCEEKSPSFDIFEKIRNTVTLCLDGSKEEVLKSYLDAITHIRLWNAQNGTQVSFESILGYQAKTYATPLEGTFYLVITYMQRSVTLVIDARTGWLNGFIGPKGVFQFKNSETAPKGTPEYYMVHILAQILSFDGSYKNIAPGGEIAGIELGIEAFRRAHKKMADYDGSQDDSVIQLPSGVMVFGILESFKSHMVSGLVASVIKDGTDTTVANSHKPSSATVVKGWGKTGNDANDILFQFQRYIRGHHAYLFPYPLPRAYEEVVSLADYVRYTLFCPYWSALRHSPFRVPPNPRDLIWSAVDEGEDDSSVLLLSEYDSSELSPSDRRLFIEQNEHYFGRRAGGQPHHAVSTLTSAILSSECHLPWWNEIPIRRYGHTLPTDQQRSFLTRLRVRHVQHQQRRTLHCPTWQLTSAKWALKLFRK